MLKFLIIAGALVACLGSPQPGAKAQPAPQAATPPPSPPAQSPESRVYCGETPTIDLLKCLEDPHVVNKEVAAKCGRRRLSECDSIKCYFRESGWSTASATGDDKIEKQKLAEHFDQHAKNFPSWAPAVQHLKAACLDKDLPPLGTELHCAAFDVMHCIQTSFLKNATPSQWRNTPDCESTRSWAAMCPVCPTSCFAPQVPYGTCNACQSLPRTP